MYTEKLIKDIKISDDYITSGNLLTNGENDSIIICLHGLGGRAKNYLALRLRDYIVDNNLKFDTFNSNIYDFKDGHRDFFDFTLEAQTKDINHLVEHFAKQYKNIYIFAASYSGLCSIIDINDKVSKLVLVDPSFIIDQMWAQDKPLDVSSVAKDIFISFDKNIAFAYHKKLKDEGLTWTAEKSQELLDNVGKPCLIFQTESVHTQLSKALDFKNQQIQTIHIPGADHSFTTYGTCNKLLEEMFKFL